MKKFIAIIMTILILCSLCACSKDLSADKPVIPKSTDDLSGTWISDGDCQVMKEFNDDDEEHFEFVVEIENPAEGEELGTIRVIEKATKTYYAFDHDYYEACDAYYDWLDTLSDDEYFEADKDEFMKENYPDVYAAREQETTDIFTWYGTYDPITGETSDYRWTSEDLDVDGNQTCHIYIGDFLNDFATADFHYKNGVLYYEQYAYGQMAEIAFNRVSE